MYARSGIEQAPLQTYVSAALFTPSKSIARQLFRETEFVDCVNRSPRMPEQWSALLLTLEGHSDWVKAVQFSPDGSKLASASHPGGVIVWDLTMNTRMEVIDVKDYVSDFAFSADGFYLKTNFGSFKLKVGIGGSHSVDACAIHLRYQKEWILRHGHKMIWLPPELRPDGHAAAIRGEIMAFGHSSGTVTFWEISG